MIQSRFVSRTQLDRENKAWKHKLDDTRRVYDQHIRDIGKQGVEAMAELQRQVDALNDQANIASEYDNTVKNLQEKNDAQRELLQQQTQDIQGHVSHISSLTACINADDKATIIDQQAKRITNLQDRQVEYDKTWTEMCDAALEVAENNSYCEEFDTLVDEVNALLTQRTEGRYMLTTRKKEFNVTLCLEVNIEEAKDEDDALEQAKDNLDNGDYGRYDLDNYASSAQET